MGLRTDIKEAVKKNTNIKRIGKVYVHPYKRITPNKRFRVMTIEVFETL